jgi:hypothetical protein
MTESAIGLCLDGFDNQQWGEAKSGVIDIENSDEKLVISSHGFIEDVSELVKLCLESANAVSGCFPSYVYEWTPDKFKQNIKFIESHIGEDNKFKTAVIGYSVDDCLFCRTVSLCTNKVIITDKWSSVPPINVCCQFLTKIPYKLTNSESAASVFFDGSPDGMGDVRLNITSNCPIVCDSTKSYCAVDGVVEQVSAIRATAACVADGEFVSTFYFHTQPEPIRISSDKMFQLASRNDDGTTNTESKFGVKILATLSANRLYVDIKTSSTQQKLRFAYYLRKIGVTEPLKKIGYRSDTKCQFALAEQGMYHVRVFVKTEIESYATGEAFSSDVFYYAGVNNNESLSAEERLTFANTLHNQAKSIRERYQPNKLEIPDIDLLDNYLKFKETERSYIPINLADLPLNIPNCPFGETAIILNCNEPNALKNITEECGLKYKFYSSHNCRVISTMRSTVLSEVDIYFEGNAFLKQTLIVGANDITAQMTADALKGLCGEFSLLTIDKDKLFFGTDFFGVNKIYYYFADGQLCASTSMHLLLLILMALNVKLEINSEVVSAKFAGYNSGMCCYAFCEDTEVKGVKLLKPDKQIECTNGNIELKNTQLHDFEICADYGDKTYEELIKFAAEELADNAVAIFSHPDYDTIVTDLTDGLDTRSNIAAISRVPQDLIGKLKLYTNNTNPPDDDLMTALAIANKFGFDWYEEHSQIRVIEDSKWTHPISSRLMSGEDVNSNPGCTVREFPRTLFIGGGNGEVCLACGHSFKDLLGNLEELSVDCFVSKTFPGQSTAAENLRSLIKAEFQNMPDVPLNTMSDLFYMYYRNRFHFSNKYNNALRVHLLNSKYGFLAKRIRFNRQNKQDYAVQLDVNLLLNPEIAEMPYRASNQKDRIREYKQAKSESPAYEISSAKLDYNKTKYDAAQNKKNTVYLPDTESYEESLKKAEMRWDVKRYSLSKNYLGALKYIIGCLSDFEAFGLYKWAGSKNRPRRGATGDSYDMRLNKLMSTAALISFVNGFNCTKTVTDAVVDVSESPESFCYLYKKKESISGDAVCYYVDHKGCCVNLLVHRFTRNRDKNAVFVFFGSINEEYKTLVKSFVDAGCVDVGIVCNLPTAGQCEENGEKYLTDICVSRLETTLSLINEPELSITEHNYFTDMGRAGLLYFAKKNIKCNVFEPTYGYHLNDMTVAYDNYYARKFGGRNYFNALKNNCCINLESPVFTIVTSDACAEKHRLLGRKVKCWNYFEPFSYPVSDEFVRKICSAYRSQFSMPELPKSEFTVFLAPGNTMFRDYPNLISADPSEAEREKLYKKIMGFVLDMYSASRNVAIKPHPGIGYSREKWETALLGDFLYIPYGIPSELLCYFDEFRTANPLVLAYGTTSALKISNQDVNLIAINRDFPSYYTQLLPWLSCLNALSATSSRKIAVINIDESRISVLARQNGFGDFEFTSNFSPDINAIIIYADKLSKTELQSNTQNLLDASDKRIVFAVGYDGNEGLTVRNCNSYLMDLYTVKHSDYFGEYTDKVYCFVKNYEETDFRAFSTSVELFFCKSTIEITTTKIEIVSTKL